VVDEEDYVDPFNEMPLEEAKRISAQYEIGDTVNVPVDNLEFGRIAAGNGKQVIIQGLREAERGMVYEEFNSKQHEILTGTVTRIDPRNNNVTLRIGTGSEATDAVLTASEQIPGEELKEDMMIKVYVVSVSRATRGAQILISRTHPGLVRRLFELEVPEIFDGTVEVKSISREPGSRTKIAVASDDEAVDPIGACVGPRGQRVNHITDELHGEKIDIIKYYDEPEKFIAAALAPAEVDSVTLAPEGKACRVRVPDNQLSLAIGREGQNARLAARLTGYKIDIKPRSYEEPTESAEASEETDAEAEASEAAEAPDDAPIDEQSAETTSVEEETEAAETSDATDAEASETSKGAEARKEELPGEGA
ncbi:MAG: transcription termination/antitermination protein NusA, partial [Oscillibacter sp.]|nr:transcription termination/antitermination protein NusA [Oscillibacter sp.]